MWPEVSLLQYSPVRDFLEATHVPFKNETNKTGAHCSHVINEGSLPSHHASEEHDS